MPMTVHGPDPVVERNKERTREMRPEEASRQGLRNSVNDQVAGTGPDRQGALMAREGGRRSCQAGTLVPATVRRVAGGRRAAELVAIGLSS